MNFFFSPAILAIIVSLSLVVTLFSSHSVCAVYHTRTRSLPPRSPPHHTTIRTKTRSLPPRFSYVRRTRTQSPVSYSPPSTTTTGTLIECPGVHKCKWYRCIDNIYMCSTKSGIEQRDRFLINYGEMYCNIATNIQSSLSLTGQMWTTNARQCLQNTLVSKVSQDPSRRQLSCTEITNTAFASHVPCYVNNGFCMLPKYDQYKILNAMKGGLVNSRSAMKTTLKIVTRCGVQLAVKAITVKVLTRMTFTAISVAFGRVYVRVRILAMGFLLQSSTAAGDVLQNRHASSLSSSNSSSSFSYVVLISPADGENSTDPLGDIATFNETSTNFTALSNALSSEGITLVSISSTSVTDVNDTCEQSGLVASSSSEQCTSSRSSASSNSFSSGSVATVAAGVSLVVIIIVIVVVAYHQKLGVFNKKTDSKQETE